MAQASGRGGTPRIRRKMAEAIDLAKLHGSGQVNRRWRGARPMAGSPTVIWQRSSPTNSRRR